MTNPDAEREAGKFKGRKIEPIGEPEDVDAPVPMLFGWSAFRSGHTMTILATNEKGEAVTITAIEIVEIPAWSAWPVARRADSGELWELHPENHPDELEA